MVGDQIKQLQGKDAGKWYLDEERGWQKIPVSIPEYKCLPNNKEYLSFQTPYFPVLYDEIKTKKNIAFKE